MHHSLAQAKLLFVSGDQTTSPAVKLKCLFHSVTSGYQCHNIQYYRVSDNEKQSPFLKVLLITTKQKLKSL